MRKLLAPSFAATVTRPGMRNTAWKPPVSIVGFLLLRRHAAPASATVDIARFVGGGAGPATVAARPRERDPACSGAIRRTGTRLADSARSAAAAPGRCRPWRCARSRPRARHPIQSSPVCCTISARRISSSAGLRSRVPVVEPRVVERRPARAAHRVADAERRARRPRSPQDRCALPSCAADWPAARPRRCAISRSISRCFSRERADRLVGRRDLVGNRAECRAPLGQRARLAFLAEAERRLRGKAFGELLARQSRRRSGRRAPRARPSAPASAFRARARSADVPRAAHAHRSRRWSRGAAVSPSTRSEAVSRPGGKSRAISVVSPCGRSTLMSARHGGAVRIDGDAVDRRADIDVAGESRTNPNENQHAGGRQSGK